MSSRPTILLADDDDNDAILIQRALRKAEVAAVLERVKDGEQAIQYLKGDGEFDGKDGNRFPAIMILDLKMPRKNGFDVLKWIRSHQATKLIPIVVFTSSREKSDVQKAYDLGANSYMVKPNSFDDMVKLMQVIGDYWLKLCSVPDSTIDGKSSSGRISGS